MKSLMKFQVPQWGHTANHKFTFCFCDGIQTKPGKINGCGYNTVTHFQPHHATKHTGSPLLVQLISLFQRFCFHIIFYFEHVQFLSHIVSLFIVFQMCFLQSVFEKGFLQSVHAVNSNRIAIFSITRKGSNFQRNDVFRIFFYFDFMQII